MTTRQEQDRNEFEEWAKSRRIIMIRDKYGEYTEPFTRARWETWQACARLNRERERERALEEAIKHVTRFEVIDWRGRVYGTGPLPPCAVQLSLQDDGRTLKVFVSRRAKGESK